MAWESDNHPWLMLAGKIGENYSVGGFSLVRTADPTADGAVLPGLLPFVRLFRNRIGYTAAVWPVPAPNRGAVLKIMINQQDGLSVR